MPGCGRSFVSSRAIVRRSVVAPERPKTTVARKLPGNQQLLRSAAAALHVQPKLRLSQEGDPAEREADAVADQIVAQQEAGPASPIPQQVNRACAKCDEEIKRAEDPEADQENDESAPMNEAEAAEDIDDSDEGDESGMPKRDGTSHATVSETAIPRGPGAPMSPQVQNRMESSFGASLGHVRIHADQASARSAKTMGALAYTVGNNVYFGAGQYSPGTTPGTRLLAHELTHVLQQGDGQSLSRKGSAKGKECPKGPGGKSVCSAGNCPQGKQKKAVTGDCAKSGPVDEDRFIKHLEVDISGHTVTATWSDNSTDTWPCSPNEVCTPRVKKDVVGDKCGINHTNNITKKRPVPDGMAWFTAFASQGHKIGFHDSQPVGKGFQSHGCVRVCCDIAKIINKNTWSGKTTITVN